MGRGDEMAIFKDGVNAIEYNNLRKLSKTDWDVVFKEYNIWAKSGYLYFFPAWFYYGLAIFAFIGYFFFTGTIHKVGLGCLILVGVQITYRTGHKEGYWSGYNDGFEKGIDKVLGISEDDHKFI